MGIKGTKKTKRIGLAAAALAIAGLGAGCLAPPPPAPSAGCAGPGGPPDAVTSTIYNATNASRSAAGRGGLGWNKQLWCLASEWSNTMAAQNKMFHRNLGAVLASPGFGGYHTLGENVLHGPAGMSGIDMHNAWMNSPTHRANILSGAFSSFAVAVAYTGGQVYATENFGG
jgi:uncharacterized protein YkwD